MKRKSMKQKPVERKQYSYATICQCIVGIIVVLLPLVGSLVYVCFFNGMQCTSDLTNPIPLGGMLLSMMLMIIIVLIQRRRVL